MATRRTRLSLTTDERNEIYRAILQDGATRLIHRLHVILLIGNGCSCVEVSRLLGIRLNTICRWAEKYQRAGVSGLHGADRPGRPKSLNAFQWSHIETDLLKSPRYFGFPAATRWDGPMLSEHLYRCYGVALGLRQCQRILRALSPLHAVTDPSDQVGLRP